MKIDPAKFDNISQTNIDVATRYDREVLRWLEMAASDSSSWEAAVLDRAEREGLLHINAEQYFILINWKWHNGFVDLRFSEHIVSHLTVFPKIEFMADWDVVQQEISEMYTSANWFLYKNPKNLKSVGREHLHLLKF